MTVVGHGHRLLTPSRAIPIASTSIRSLFLGQTLAAFREPSGRFCPCGSDVGTRVQSWRQHKSPLRLGQIRSRARKKRAHLLANQPLTFLSDPGRTLPIPRKKRKEKEKEKERKKKTSCEDWHGGRNLQRSRTETRGAFATTSMYSVVGRYRLPTRATCFVGSCPMQR